MESRRITAVIIAYHSDELVLECVSELSEVSKVIVVDNAAGGNLPQRLREIRNDAEHIATPGNCGFGIAANFGLEKVETEFVVVLNPDAELPSNGFASFVRAMDRDVKLGALGRLRPMRIWRFVIGSYVSGSCLFLRRSAIDRLGGFDPRFFLFFEDTDISVRLVKAGYRLGELPDMPEQRYGNSVSISHDSVGERQFLLGVSCHIFERKWKFSRFGLWAAVFIRRLAFRAARRGSTRHMEGYRLARRIGSEAYRCSPYGALLFPSDLALDEMKFKYGN